MNFRNFFFTAVVFVFLSSIAFCQDVKITEVTQDEGNLEITYRLSGTSGLYLLALTYESPADGSLKTAKFVSGDIGYFVKPGFSNVVKWQIANDIVFFEGNLKYDLVATPMFPFEKKVRRGRSLVIDYLLPEESKLVALSTGYEEIDAGIRIDTSDHKIRLTIPKKAELRDYNLELLLNDGTKVTDYSIAVKRKFPLFYPIAVGTAMVGAATYYFISQQNQPAAELPGPPDINDF